MNRSILIGKSGQKDSELLLSMINRHGLIAGATGTGKTVTLRVIAEGLSRCGVPVFMADIKGDLAGISQAGETNEKITDRLSALAVDAWGAEAFPVTFWDVFGEHGHPIRTTISEIGPLYLARLLNLNETQAGVLNLVFKVANDRDIPLVDLTDLRSLLTNVGQNAKELTLRYGNVSSASIGAIQRALLALEESGGERLFGEPALVIDDLLQTDEQGRGVINILCAERLLLSPLTYSTLLLWLLSELFERLPEVGDLEKPKMVFFFDEAHLLFDEAPKALLGKIEQVVRLIRSRGVGVFFVSQSPLDIAEPVLGQLGNRVQHALRTFTAKDQRAARATAETFRSDNPGELQVALGELAIGEAIISLLDQHGTPSLAQRTLVLPPSSRLGTITSDERSAIIKCSNVFGTYEIKGVRRAPQEKLTSKGNDPATAGESLRYTRESTEQPCELPDISEKPAKMRKKRSPFEAMITSAARSLGSQLGRAICRGIFGSLSGMSPRRRR
jgi:DNA helicase HerA-like ATPase